MRFAMAVLQELRSRLTKGGKTIIKRPGKSGANPPE
jgi:hypothetical protein